MQNNRLRGVLVRAVATALAGTVGVAGAAIAVDLTGGPASTSQEPTGHEGGSAPPGTTRTQLLVARHGCWTSAAEMPRRWRGRLPGHVVASTAHGRPRWSAGQVGPALAHVFDDRYPRLTVYAFCR